MNMGGHGLSVYLSALLAERIDWKRHTNRDSNHSTTSNQPRDLGQLPQLSGSQFPHQHNIGHIVGAERVLILSQSRLSLVSKVV